MKRVLFTSFFVLALASIAFAQTDVPKPPLSDTQMIVALVGAFIGVVAHVVNEKVKAGEKESEVFRRWFLNRPTNTVLALAAAGGIALGLVVPTATTFQIFFTALVAGVASNEIMNRPGE